MAENLEATAKALRDSAALFQHFQQSATVSFKGAAQTSFHPARATPSVRVACIVALETAGRPLHVSELFAAIRSQGATIKDVANLSTMLSRDETGTFEIAPGAERGFWRLARAVATCAGARPSAPTNFALPDKPTKRP